MQFDGAIALRALCGAVDDAIRDARFFVACGESLCDLERAGETRDGTAGAAP